MICNLCNLHLGAKCVKVAPRLLGSPTKGCIMIVGEAPGYGEDEANSSFIGNAGKMLDKLLDKSGISEAYITNVVKCIPKTDTGVRAPSEDEIKCCIKYLYEEIYEMRPRVIVLLGNTPLGAFTGTYSGVSRKCGEILDVTVKDFKTKAVICIHPSAILHGDSGNYTDKSIKALSIAKLIYEGVYETKSYGKLIYGYTTDLYNKFLSKDELPEHITDVVVVESLEEIKLLAQDIVSSYKNRSIDRLAMDTETSSLLQYRNSSYILCISLSVKEGSAYVIPVGHVSSKLLDNFYLPDSTRLSLSKIFGELFSTLPMVGQNIKFDIHWMIKEFAIERFNLHMDTMLAEHVLVAGKVYDKVDLDSMVRDRLHLPMYSDTIGEYVSKTGKQYSMVPKDILYPYSGMDADVTLRISKQQEYDLKKLGLWDMYRELYVSAIMPTVRMESKGLKVDYTMYEKLLKDFPTEMDKHKDAIKSTIAFEIFKLKTGLDDINLKSPKQKATLIFDVLKFPVVNKTEKGSPSTNEESIEELLEMCSDEVSERKGILDHIVSYTKSSTLYSLFIKKLPELWSEEGTPDYWKFLTGKDKFRSDYMIHTSFMIGQATTGRWRCSSPNLQQMPFRSSIKEMFVSSFGDDGVICVSDYCLTGDTKIATLEGDIEISEIVSRFSKGEKFHVYCYMDDKSRVGFSKIVAANKTGVNRDVYRVHLDNGEYVTATPDHKFMMRDGSYREVKELSPGDSLMPLYRKIRGGYREVYSNDGYWMSEYRTVANDLIGDPTGKVVHHIDRDQLNDRPDNLVLMSSKEHMSTHMVEFWSEDSNKKSMTDKHWTKTPEGKSKLSKSISKSWSECEDYERELRCRSVSRAMQKIGGNRGEANGMYGKRHTDETKNKIRMKAVGRVCTHMCGDGNPTKRLEVRKKMSDIISSQFRNGRISQFSDKKFHHRDKACVFCNVTFHTLGSHNAHFRYCRSNPDRIDSVSSKNMIKEVNKNCPHCGKLCVKQSSYVGHISKCKERLLVLNHKVVKIEYVGKSDVYDLTVDKYHNFAVSAGIIISNSQQELRIMAMLAKSDEWKEIFLSGEDFHLRVASMMFKKPPEEIDEDTRRIAKTINFGILYGRGPESVSEVCALSVEEAKRAMDIYFESFPSIAKWRKWAMNFGEKNGFIYSPLGRIRYLPQYDSGDIGAGNRRAMNSPIQGTGSDCIQLGMMYTDEEFRNKSMDSYPFSIIHDSMETDIKLTELIDAVKLLKYSQVDRVENRIKDWSYGIPLSVEFELGVSWGECVESDGGVILDENSITFDFVGEQKNFDRLTERLGKCYKVEYLDKLPTAEKGMVRYMYKISYGKS